MCVVGVADSSFQRHNDSTRKGEFILLMRRLRLGEVSDGLCRLPDLGAV